MKEKVKSILVTLFSVALITLLLSNPGESSYLRELSAQFAKFHDHEKISHDVFRNIGRHHRQNYFLFSTFDYTFQGRSYFYVGVANMVFYAGSKYDRRGNNVYKVI